jgi:large subunit ribosomal protein L13
VHLCHDSHSRSTLRTAGVAPCGCQKSGIEPAFFASTTHSGLSYTYICYNVQIIGRLAPQIGKLLAGKHKPTYQPHVDHGDWVVVVNAKHAVFTSDKMRTKLYHWHTGWMGGLKTLTARQIHERAPERLIETAVKGMLPPNKLRNHRMKRLRIFSEEEHEHGPQVISSTKYASEFLLQTAPKKFSPAPQQTTGNLVSDVYAVKNDKALAGLSKDLVAEDPKLALAKLEAELARRATAVAAAASELK